MTKGTCSNCAKTLTKAAMTRHVVSCGRREHGPPALVVSVSDRHAPADYWLHLEVPAEAALRTLDDCLRDLWLECCGHLSMFEIGGRRYTLDVDLLGGEPSPFHDADERSMEVGVGVVLPPGAQARHLYDMGSTTELQVRCIEQRSGHADGVIALLARNEPPRIECSVCGAAATTTCTECGWDGPAALCEGCAAGHPCDDELYLPIVNSPRSGVCGYTAV